MGAYWDEERRQWVQQAPPPLGAVPPPIGAVPPPIGAVPPPIGAVPPPPMAPPPLGAVPPPIGAAPAFSPSIPPAAPPARSGGRMRPRAVLIAALVGVLAGAGAGGGWYLYGRHDGGDSKAKPAVLATPIPTTPGAAPPYPDFTFPASPSASATATPTPTPTTGLHTTTVQDAAGFTLPVPDGWQRRVDGTSVFYESPDGTSLIQVFSMGADSPYNQALATDSSLSSNPSRFPGYRKLRLDQIAGGVVLEYSYDLAGKGVRHTVDQIVTGPDGNSWALLVAGPETSWPAPLRDVQQDLTQHFCLAGHCPAG